MPTTISGTTGVSQVQDGSVTPTKMSGNQTGNAPVYGCRAWVVFNGSTGVIEAAGNVTNVVRNSAGDYTVNFTTAMQDALYSAIVTGSGGTVGTTFTSRAVGSVVARTYNTAGGAPIDSATVSVAIFR